MLAPSLAGVLCQLGPQSGSDTKLALGVLGGMILLLERNKHVVQMAEGSFRSTRPIRLRFIAAYLEAS